MSTPEPFQESKSTQSKEPIGLASFLQTWVREPIYFYLYKGPRGIQMLDKETQEALEGLDENDVFKVGEMIRKLADENNKPTTRSNADDFVHKIERNKNGT